jgi:predicted  nucleic acid-binding Zn-ribbon protein
VRRALVLNKNLAEHHANLDQVLNLLTSAESASIDVTTIIELDQEFQRSGLSPDRMTEALAFKAKLEERGFNLTSLDILADLIKKHSDPQEMLKAVSEYQSLAELKNQSTTAKKQLDNLNLQIVSADQQLNQVKGELTKEKTLQAAHLKVVELGFTEKVLVRLSALTKKYGTVGETLKAVQAYANYADIVNNIHRAKFDQSSIQTETGKLETQHAHLRTAISMCQTLIQQYNFGLDAISTIFSVAKKYGEPVAVLKSVEALGSLQFINNELAKQEGKLEGIREQCALLEGKYREMLHNFESLHAVTLKTGAEVGKLQSQLENDRELEKVINLIKNPSSADYQDYGALVVAIATSLQKWVTSNEKRFRSSYSIQSGLKALVTELGGN